MTRRVVIIGAGQAGCQLALSLRERRFDGAIALIGGEPGPPYQRPPLSKAFLLGKAEAADLALKPISTFAEKAIDFLPGSRATAIDRAARRVGVAGHGSLGYDHLVIATGAENRALPVPGADLDGVLALRSLADAARLKQRLAPARRLAIIGAGFIGMEVAAVARQLGLEVTVIERAERVLARAVSPPVSGHLLARHQAAGVRFRFGAAVECFEGDGGALRAVGLTDGTVVPADLALVAIGVAPGTGLAEQAGLAVGDGILVDALLATADPAIHAIGDCASYPHALFDGRRMRVESVQNAADQARCLAMTLTGEPMPYARLPWFWSDQGEARLQIAGIAEPEDEAVIRGDPATGRFSVFRLCEGRLSAVESIGQPGEHMAARRLVAARPRLDPAIIRNPAIPPAALADAGTAALAS